MITTALYFFPNAGIDTKEQVAQLVFQKTTSGECTAMVFPIVEATVSCIAQTTSPSMKAVLLDVQKYVNSLAQHIGGREDVREFAEEVVSRFPFNFKTSNLNDFPPESLSAGALAEFAHAIRVRVQTPPKSSIEV